MLIALQRFNDFPLRGLDAAGVGELRIDRA